MIEFGGITYYIDLETLDKVISPIGSKPTDKIKQKQTTSTKDGKGELFSVEITETVSDKGKEVDGAKYEIIRFMFEVLMDNKDELDSALGIERAMDNTPLSYKIAFNTLYNYGILKEK